MANKFIPLLKEHIGKDVRMAFHIIPAEGIAVIQQYTWTGKIVDIQFDSGHGGFLVFEHCELDSKRMEVERSYLNLAVANIWVLDILSEEHSEDAYVKCPHCGKASHMTRLVTMSDDELLGYGEGQAPEEEGSEG